MEVRDISIEAADHLAQIYQVSNVFCDPKFLSVVEECFSVKSYAKIVYHKDLPVCCLVFYVKGKRIVHPSSYFYSGIWINSNSEILIEDAILNILKVLQKIYSSVEFLLPPSIIDIRAFIYTGFKADVKYTYSNNLDNINHSSTIKSRWNKSEKLNIKFSNIDDNELIDLQLKSFRKLGYKESYIKTIGGFITKLKHSNHLMPVSARLNKTLLASAYILLDWHTKTAFNLFITSNKKYYSTGVHSSIYLYNFEQLKKTGFKKNDLFGATTKGIGNFKGGFKGELMPYYYVRYNKWRWIIVRLLRDFYETIKKLRLLNQKK